MGAEAGGGKTVALLSRVVERHGVGPWRKRERGDVRAMVDGETRFEAKRGWKGGRNAAEKQGSDTGDAVKVRLGCWVID